LNKYIRKCPFAVLTLAAIRGLIADEFEQLFERHRTQPYRRTLTFSAMATAVADVVLRFAENFFSASARDAQGQSVGIADKLLQQVL
jgi:hypothetical protein